MGADRHAPVKTATVDSAPPAGRADIAPAEGMPTRPTLLRAIPPHVGLAGLPAGHHQRFAIDQLQHSLGNAFVGRLLDGTRAAVQRHPDGAPLTHDPAGAADEIANPAPLAAEGATADAASDDDAVAEAPQPETEPATAAPDGEAAPVAPDKPVPAPASRGLMDLATAQEVLTQAYGQIKEIVGGKIVLLPNREAVWRRHDKIAKGRKNPFNGGLPWQDGDSEKYVPGMDGFAEQETDTIYLNKRSELATATAHEVLHLNEAEGWRAAVGMMINEGVTEYLAMMALLDAGVPSGEARAYTKEVQLAVGLAREVTRETLIEGYFKGADAVITKFDGLKGAGTFAELRRYADQENWADAQNLLGI